MGSGTRQENEAPPSCPFRCGLHRHDGAPRAQVLEALTAAAARGRSAAVVVDVDREVRIGHGHPDRHPAGTGVAHHVADGFSHHGGDVVGQAPRHGQVDRAVEAHLSSEVGGLGDLVDDVEEILAQAPTGELAALQLEDGRSDVAHRVVEIRDGLFEARRQLDVARPGGGALQAETRCEDPLDHRVVEAAGDAFTVFDDP